MALLRDHFVKQGAFFFRWRSFLPLLLAAIAITALPQSTYLDIRLGENTEWMWDLFSVLVAFSGLAVRVATVGFAPAGTSGRNTKEQRADALNTTGLYSVVRNPLYLGNIITLLGFLLAVKVWWLIVLGLPIALLYYERIIFAEEAYLVLKFGPAYERWVAQTPALIPRLSQWRRPALPFSLRTAVAREHHGFYVIVVVMTVLEILTDVVGEGDPFVSWARENSGWCTFFAIGTLVFVAIRVIYKRTVLLVVDGR